MALQLVVTGLQGARAEGQVAGLDSIKNQEELDKAVGALDAALFDAYNRFDLVKFAVFLWRMWSFTTISVGLRWGGRI
jgi:hypothetical protein